VIMVRNVLIFGADASLGSELTNMPPIGNTLFDELAKFSPQGWGVMPDNLANIFREDFEKGMKELSNNYTGMMTQIQIIMATYFFKFLPTQSSLYLKLSQKIKNTFWDGAIVTLNYERLLELCLRHVGLIPIPQESTFPNIEVCYPHGCCNIFCEGISATRGINIGKNSISFRPGESLNFGQGGSVNFTSEGITTGGNAIRIINNPNEFYQKTDNTFPPVMSYFIPSKFTTLCANFIHMQRERFSKLVKQAENIAIVGIQVRPNDLHIWNHLSNCTGKIIYCSGTGGKKYKEWAKLNRKNFDNDMSCKHIGMKDLIKYVQKLNYKIQIFYLNNIF